MCSNLHLIRLKAKRGVNIKKEENVKLKETGYGRVWLQTEAEKDVELLFSVEATQATHPYSSPALRSPTQASGQCDRIGRFLKVLGKLIF